MTAIIKVMLKMGGQMAQETMKTIIDIIQESGKMTKEMV